MAWYNWQEWQITDFSAGYIDKAEDHVLPENASSDCQNVIGKLAGSIKKRSGQARLNASALGGVIQGIYPYYGNGTRKLIVAANGSVYYWNSATSAFVSIKSGLNASAQVMFESCLSAGADHLVVFNGVDEPWKWDGTTVSQLSTSEYRPQDGIFAVLHAEKMFTVDASEQSVLRWSGTFAPETWEAIAYWKVKDGDGDVITNIQKFLGELIIFKRRSIHVLHGTSMDNFRLEEMEGIRGCVGKRAACVDKNYVYFVSDEGLCVWNGMRVMNISEGIIPVLWETINKEYIHNAAVGAWGGFIWFALPEGASTYNNLIVAYEPPLGDTPGRFWIWRNIDASCFCRFNDGTSELFYSGDSNAGYVNLQDYGTSDFGEPIEAYWTGKSLTLGLGDRKNRFQCVFVNDVPAADDVSIQMSVDYGDYFNLKPDRSDGLARRFNFTRNYNGKYIRPKLIHNQAGDFEVRGIKILFRPMTRLA